MRAYLTTLLGISIGALTIQSMPATACTDFRLAAKDGTIVIARSMEFALDLQSNLRTSPRNHQFVTNTNDQTPAMSWKSKYGYVYVDALNQAVAVDGMNEVGLSLESLYLPGETTYQNIPAGKETQALPYLSFGDWILGNFQNVDEVQKALPNIYVFAQSLAALNGMIFPLHYAIHDATGKSIVVEFVKGEMKIYPNDVGVMTNSPTFDWQIVNLRNFVNLSPYNPTPTIINGVAFAATGQGAGMMGLPGDISPPSRFVKIAFLSKYATQANDSLSTVNLAEHIINNVDIPAGTVRAINNGKESTETTQWVVIKDLTHKIFYYRTYNDLTLKSVDMSKLNFNENATPLKMPLEQHSVPLDVTGMFAKTQG